MNAQVLVRKPKRLAPLDAMFLQIETRDTPMHVAGLQVFQLADDAPDDFVRNVVEKLRSPVALAKPFNLKLADVRLSRMAPALVETHNIDFDYHVRHSALPAPGGERELGELVSHLHSQLLDRSRPLWTCHVIEGLENNRFAIYNKIHHALVDGMRAMNIFTRCLGTGLADDNWSPPWAAREANSRNAPAGSSARKAGRISPLTLPKLTRDALMPLLRRKAVEPVRLPFEAPNSIINGRVTAARRVATQRLDLEQVKRIAKRTDTSVNDVFLAVCGAALRRHLQEGGDLPASSLIAGVPVSLRQPGDEESGNAVGFVWSVLGTELDDPAARLQAVQRSMRASKQHLNSLPAAGRMPYSALTMLPALGVILSGQGAKVKPPMNVVISNVPGPSTPLYLGKAALEAMYPVSIPFQGLGLNITCVSYADQLTIGFTGSRDCLPHLQRVAVYASEALDELEQAVLATK